MDVSLNESANEGLGTHLKRCGLIQTPFEVTLLIEDGLGEDVDDTATKRIRLDGRLYVLVIYCLLPRAGGLDNVAF
jgi:hypothetical protein